MKRKLETKAPTERSGSVREDDIKIYLKEIGCDGVG
jgi:hypothetical protein